MTTNGIYVTPATDGLVDVEITYENPEQLGLPLTLTRKGALKLAWSLLKAALK